MGIFYRFTNDKRRKIVDMYDLYRGSIFLCGGHPSLKEEDLTQFSLPGVTTLAMNNTGALFRPTLWVSADKPICYSPSIINDPGVLKFARLAHSHQMLKSGKFWHEVPSTLFYSDTPEFTVKNVLHRTKKFAWWKNIFVIAIQLAYRLGFRKIYLCGVGLDITPEAQYAYNAAKLNQEQINYNQRTYNNVFGQLKDALPHYRSFGLDIISCTPNSKTNEILPFIPLKEAINLELEAYPKLDLKNILHSSELKSRKG